jgi:hypothetical protein
MKCTLKALVVLDGILRNSSNAASSLPVAVPWATLTSCGLATKKGMLTNARPTAGAREEDRQMGFYPTRSAD